MTFVFRVDASTPIGIGHLMRCLTLAEVLQSSGAITKFICRAHPGNLIHLLQEKGMSVAVLPPPVLNDPSLGQGYARWLGVSQQQDTEQSISALNAERPDWLIVDHYGLDADWERRIRPHVGKVMVIDDLANRAHECDVLLDQNYSEQLEQRYKGLVPESCTILNGPKYALLRPEYGFYRTLLQDHVGKVERIFVFFGGSDANNVTGMALEVLSHPNLQSVQVDVVVGANNPHLNSIQQQIANRPNTTLYGPRSHLADLMAKADLALGAGGVSTSERLCLGVPSMVISIAENQVESCLALHRAGYINYLGCQEEVNATDLFDKLLAMMGNPQNLIRMSSAGKNLVDGTGISTIKDTLGI